MTTKIGCRWNHREVLGSQAILITRRLPKNKKPSTLFSYVKPYEMKKRTKVQRFNGGHSEGETPFPIPNREVKPFSADGTTQVGE